MTETTFKDRLAGPDPLAGTFMKTPSIDVLEVLMLSGLDFVVLDAEHAPFDRRDLSACCAIARAHGFPVLVRPTAATPDQVLSALDMGATGIVAPHVMGGTGARALSRSARFGRGGRGFAGSTRWADYATRPMAELLDRSARETVVIAQIEDVEAVDAAEAIIGTEGIDGVFVGPADLSVALGKRDQTSEELAKAMADMGRIAGAAGKACWTFTPGPDPARALVAQGYTGFCMASDHAWMLAGARAAVAGLKTG